MCIGNEVCHCIKGSVTTEFHPHSMFLWLFSGSQNKWCDLIVAVLNCLIFVADGMQ